MPDGRGPTGNGQFAAGPRRRRAARLLQPARRAAAPWHARIWPLPNEHLHTLFIPTGRRTFRLNWRNPLALPLVLAAVVLSPALLLWALVVAAGDARERLRRGSSPKRSAAQ